MSTDEIIEKTKHLYCYGEYDDGLVRRIEYARTLQPGEKVVEFGIGNGRTGMVLSMANPDIYIYTFDKGRREIIDEDLFIRTMEWAHELGVYRYFPMIGEALTVLPNWHSPIGYLGIDTDGEGTGEQLKRWAPFVRSGAKIFVQNYGLDKYPKIQIEVDEFIKNNTRYRLGVRTGKLNGGCSVLEIEVI